MITFSGTVAERDCGAEQAIGWMEDEGDQWQEDSVVEISQYMWIVISNVDVLNLSIKRNRGRMNQETKLTNMLYKINTFDLKENGQTEVWGKLYNTP